MRSTLVPGTPGMTWRGQPGARPLSVLLMVLLMVLVLPSVPAGCAQRLRLAARRPRQS
jgi:hypothetical protein